MANGDLAADRQRRLVRADDRTQPDHLVGTGITKFDHREKGRLTGTGALAYLNRPARSTEWVDHRADRPKAIQQQAHPLRSNQRADPPEERGAADQEYLY